MDAPKCFRCDTRHWSTQSCPSDQRKPATVDAVAEIFAKAEAAGAKVHLSRSLKAASKIPATKQKFDKKAYQRDLMRKRRAELKAATEKS